MNMQIRLWHHLVTSSMDQPLPPENVGISGCKPFFFFFFKGSYIRCPVWYSLMTHVILADLECFCTQGSRYETSVPVGQRVGNVSAWPDWATVYSSAAGSGKAARECARAPHPEVVPFSPAHPDTMTFTQKHNKYRKWSYEERSCVSAVASYYLSCNFLIGNTTFRTARAV